MTGNENLIAFSENFGKGIGNRTRFKMLILLSEKPCSVGEIAEHVTVSQPTASQHLKILSAANLIINDKRGQYVYYSLNYDYLLDNLKELVLNLEKYKPRM